MSWKVPLLIGLTVLLIAALGLAFWLSESPPGAGNQMAAEGSQPAGDAVVPGESGQIDATASGTEPGNTASTEASNSQGGAGASNQSGSSPGKNTNPGTSSGSNPTEPAKRVQLTCEQYSMFSGQFVEDGRDELVTNVAAILVTNVSDQFLDLATIAFDIDGEAATFIVTGLPAGRSAWVLEANRMTVTNSSNFTYLDMTTSFRDGVAASSDKVTITADGNMLTATNNTDETLEGVFIYYRTLHTDGNFLGGITYLVDFGTLEPGGSVEKMGGHFSEDSEIVRIGWGAQ